MAEQREPSESSVVESDAGESGMDFEPCKVQEQPNIEVESLEPKEESVQSNSLATEEQPDVKEGVVAKPTQSGLGLESHTIQEQSNNEKDTIEALLSLGAASALYNLGNTGQIDGEADNGMQAGSAAVVQPTQAGFQEQQPNVEEGAIQAGSGVAVQPANASPGLDSPKSNVKEDALALQSIMTAFNRHYLNNSDFLDMGEQDDGQQVQDLEEENGIQARTGDQQMQDVPPEQGTAGRRMRLQVSNLQSASNCKGKILGLQLLDAGSRCYELHAASLEAPLGCAKGLNESKRVSIGGTCMCDGTLLEQETGKAEGDTIKPIRAESSEYLDVVQQTPQDASGPSSTPRLRLLTSLVNLLLGLLGGTVSCLHLKPSYVLRW